MVTLIRNESLPRDKQKFIEKPSPLYDGSPFLDGKKILRMRNRTDGARDLSMDSRRPIILPRESRITRLLVQHYHAKYFHQNHNTVINEIRQQFYIPRLRVFLKSVRNDCQTRGADILKKPSLNERKTKNKNKKKNNKK